MIQRGEIWWAELSEPSGSEPGFRHPVAVLQSNDFNRSRINTVVVAVISSNLHLSGAPGNVFLPKQLSHLAKDSVINVSQIATIDKTCFTKKICSLPEEVVFEMEEGIRLVIAL